VIEEREWHIQRFPILSSTNGLALDWMESGHIDAWYALVANEQTSGRGRQGRKWHSDMGADLVGWVALAAGIAVASAVRDLGAPAGVKWPNDIVLDGGKLGGILVESNYPKLAAVGIGLNVRNPLPEGVSLPAARLADSLRRAWAELDTTHGRRVRWSPEGLTGTAEGVDADGALLLRLDDGSQAAARVGDITFLP
jgi:BirA family biotin operon repressor/biotin-[acetyl-CoA-carboxylase] ligase